MKTSIIKITSNFFNNFRPAFIAVALLIVLIPGGCSSVSVVAYKDEKPALILEDYLNGTFDAYGLFSNWQGQVTRRMHVVMKASWTGDIGVLDEEFTWSDGEKQKRVYERHTLLFRRRKSGFYRSFPFRERSMLRVRLQALSL